MNTILSLLKIQEKSLIRHLTRNISSFYKFDFDINAHKKKVEEWRKEARILDDDHFLPFNECIYKYPELFKWPKSFLYSPKTYYKKKVFLKGPGDHDLGNISQTDILIIGGGLFGTSLAYFLKKDIKKQFTVAVVERDLELSSSALSLGGIRNQFQLKENILLSVGTSDFLRRSNFDLSHEGFSPPSIEYSPQGFLFLHNYKYVEEILKITKLQRELGAFIDLLDNEMLSIMYPWLNTQDIAFGTLGVLNEGCYNPYIFLHSLKYKAELLGAQFLEAELIDFNIKQYRISDMCFDHSGNPAETCNHAIIRHSDGEIEQIEFSLAVIATGAFTPEISDMLKLGHTNNDFRSYGCPITRKKRFYYLFNCPNGPTLDFPILVDQSGIICRRHGLGGHFIVTKIPTKDEEPDTNDLKLDVGYFERIIKPLLAKRVKPFSNINFIEGWAVFEDHNLYDGSLIFGRHPYYYNFFWGVGFGPNSTSLAPYFSKLTAEYIINQNEESILDQFCWDRMLLNHKVHDMLQLSY